MEKISYRQNKLRVPVAEGDIQVNFCKNPACPNYGVSASTKKQPRGPGAKLRGRDNYKVQASGTQWPFLKCLQCNEYPPTKSNHAIQEELLRLRRRLSLLERPIASAGRARRMWHGYSSYNPESIIKMLSIFRTFYNYTQAGKDLKTPAMRLGLAKGLVKLEDIIYE